MLGSRAGVGGMRLIVPGESGGDLVDLNAYPNSLPAPEARLSILLKPRGVKTCSVRAARRAMSLERREESLVVCQ